MDLRTVIDLQTYEMIVREAPKWYVCPIYKVTFEEEGVYQAIVADNILEFAPGLERVLVPGAAPGVDFLRQLPTAGSGRDIWGVYLLLLEKAGCCPRIYIGSGTSSRGLNARFKEYDVGKNIPRFVASSVKDGYTITHRTLLCWCPVPHENVAPRARLRFVAVEALFCLLFHASAATVMDDIWSDLCV
ncbi:carbamoyl-phosphate synthase (glutamine-hydrolyzing) cpa2 [Sporothrix bragantina]|uniref:Carbamoyl-phosphate synthase (Glutamine-hydrolyzing) cpa2 n=1 Tax=Sporothrix bragantina TaxID=671064 RepID=A0ABP0ATB5_9PEZI